MTETDTAKAETGPETHAEGADAAIARKIWLAGLGAYGRIAAETQGVVEKLSASAHETFEQLVSQGAEVEEKVKATIAKAPQTDTVTHAVETAASRAKTFTEESRLALETSFAKVRGLGSSGGHPDGAGGCAGARGRGVEGRQGRQLRSWRPRGFEGPGESSAADSVSGREDDGLTLRGFCWTRGAGVSYPLIS
jgi:hypothetical protein